MYFFWFKQVVRKESREETRQTYPRLAISQLSPPVHQLSSDQFLILKRETSSTNEQRMTPAKAGHWLALAALTSSLVKIKCKVQ